MLPKHANEFTNDFPILPLNDGMLTSDALYKNTALISRLPSTKWLTTIYDKKRSQLHWSWRRL